MSRFHIVVGGSIFAIAGCSTYPQPEDITPNATLSVVKQIRCEAKEALTLELIETLETAGHGPTQRRGEKLRGLYEQKRFGELDRELQNFRYVGLSDAAIERISGYVRSSIGYSFKFQITENNDNGIDTAFRMPFTGGIFSLGISAGSSLERVGSREFTITEEFINYRDLNCHTSPDTGETFEAKDRSNMLYPITGRVGVGDVLRTFIGLADNRGEADLTTYSDTLTFTTTISGGINPKIEMDSVVDNKFKLTKADLTSAAARKDLHEVKIALGLPTITPSTHTIVLKPGVKLVVDRPPAAAPAPPPAARALRGRKALDPLTYPTPTLQTGREAVIQELNTLRTREILQNLR